MKKLSFSKKLAFLGIVGGVVSAAVLAVKKFLVKIKESTVSLVQNRLRPQTQKIAPDNGVRHCRDRLARRAI